ncbi:MAG: hypothetical protein OXU36_11340 [Candidatus Poribacteria bacterium]|nr:hypothetical protein [Candidatus Poribacteria bacterium]MYA70591.1 hypothetical protein [Candidatus Poribacteria bacterium]MYH82000.1 hypothetical protein [Candidatus Poribacteria bacterium]
MQASYENPPTDVPSFRQSVQQELANLHKEVDTVSVEDSEFYPAPELVYNDALFLLEMLHHSGIPTPDISWSEDDSLNLTWHPEAGIATLEIYGNGLVIYNATRDDERPDEVSFTLTDTICLQDCFTKLNRLFQ